jgi:hypothetical protein
MRKFAGFLAVVALVALVLSGCATSRITNLTTSRQPRNPSGVYPVEFAWESIQQSVIDGSIKPSVMVPSANGGFDFYPMRPALDIKNRWETVVPVPADKRSMTYQFKVDYQYRAFGKPEKSSLRSVSYRLDIVDK